MACREGFLGCVGRVNLELPTVEVRFEDLHIETEVYAETSRQLPSLLNAVRGIFEVHHAFPLTCNHTEFSRCNQAAMQPSPLIETVSWVFNCSLRHL